MRHVRATSRVPTQYRNLVPFDFEAPQPVKQTEIM